MFLCAKFGFYGLHFICTMNAKYIYSYSIEEPDPNIILQ